MDGHDYGYIKNTLIYFYISVICYKFKHGCISLQIQFSYLLVFIPKQSQLRILKYHTLF